MSEITNKDIEYIANLSRIKVTDSEKEKFASDLKQIVDYVGKLNELDDELNQKGINPTLHAWEGKGTLLRPDESKESINRTAILKQAPNANKDFFSVNKIIE